MARMASLPRETAAEVITDCQRLREDLRILYVRLANTREAAAEAVEMARVIMHRTTRPRPH